MSLSNHLTELSSRHKKLDDALQDELKRPAADSIRMRQIKREKLQLKEQITTLKRASGQN